MYQELLNKEKKLAVIGLGYVGLPIALEFAKHIDVIGFDISQKRVDMMTNGHDPSFELNDREFEGKSIVFTADKNDLKDASFFIVAVPTPVDTHKVPDLGPLKSASKMIGEVIKKGDYVVYESTVYPGCTEEDCIPIIEKLSGLKFIEDFKVGYSPERINPGDKEHTITNIIKVVSGCDNESLEEIAKTYEIVVEPGTHRASSIKVAEAAKVIENTQRDLNIALMNELSMIFDKLGIHTKDVVEAAGTKWNFQKFYPGLVGGHCIGVDPYYLTYKANELGHTPQVILSGRIINDRMAGYVASKVVQMLIKNGKHASEAKVLVMGTTFKENVADIRNSKVAELVSELEKFSVNVDVVDPHADTDEVHHEYGFSLKPEIGTNYNAIIVAVNHDEYLNLDEDYFKSIGNGNPILIDLKSIYNKKIKDIDYWTL